MQFGTSNFAAAAPVLKSIRLVANLKKGFEPDFSKKGVSGHKIAQFHNGAAFVSSNEEYFGQINLGTTKGGFTTVSYVYSNGEVITQSKDAIRNFALEITGAASKFESEIALIEQGDISPLLNWGFDPDEIVDPHSQLQQAYWFYSEELVGKIKFKFNSISDSVGQELEENYDSYRSIVFDFPVDQDFPFHEEQNTQYTYININVGIVDVSLGKTVNFTGPKFGALLGRAAASTAQAQSLDPGTVFAEPNSVVQGAKSKVKEQMSKTQLKKQRKRAESEARRSESKVTVAKAPVEVEVKEKEDLDLPIEVKQINPEDLFADDSVRKSLF